MWKACNPGMLMHYLLLRFRTENRSSALVFSLPAWCCLVKANF
jgi:hypothetical protein